MAAAMAALLAATGAGVMIGRRFMSSQHNAPIYKGVTYSGLVTQQGRWEGSGSTWNAPGVGGGATGGAGALGGGGAAPAAAPLQKSSSGGWNGSWEDEEKGMERGAPRRGPSRPASRGRSQLAKKATGWH